MRPTMLRSTRHHHRHQPCIEAEAAVAAAGHQAAGEASVDVVAVLPLDVAVVLPLLLQEVGAAVEGEPGDGT